MLFIAEPTTPETREVLATVAGAALFDFASVADNEIIAQILSHADSLKIRPAAPNSGEAD